MRKVEFRKDCSLSFLTKHPVRKVELRKDCSLQFSDKKNTPLMRKVELRKDCARQFSGRSPDEKGCVGEGLLIAVF